MEIDICSDLHLNHYAGMSKEVLDNWQPSGEVLVVAGDTFDAIGSGSRHEEALRRLRDKYERMILIMGNHDYFMSEHDASMGHFRNLCQKLQIDGLENETVEIDGVVFAGTTLWYPWQEGDSYRFSDFRYIQDHQEKVGVKHLAARKFLAGLPEKSVVITHHLPSYQCVHPNYEEAGNNQFYVGEVDEILQAISAQIWIFGHTHERMDFYIEGTRLLCHPRGYPFEGGEVFQPLTVSTE